LFHSGVFSQAAVDGPARGAPSAAGNPAFPLPDVAPEIGARIQMLLLAEKHESGLALTSKLEQLDIVLFASLLPRAVQCFFLEVVKIEHLPGRAPMKDIGNIVRRLMLRWNSNEVLFRMYQYSMPFVKHNRLQFPAFEHISMQDLHHMLNVVQNLTLGVQQGATKMPTWTTRHQLLRFFQNLLTRGSSMDLYIFLSSHMYLLRLALIENFITFTNTYMPLEVSLMRCFVDSSYDHARVSRLVRYIVDNFRMTALQENLDFARLEAKAQIAIERCNRTCRSMQNISGPQECAKKVRGKYGSRRSAEEGEGRPLVPLTSTDHDVPYPAGCRRPGNLTRAPRPASGSRAGEFYTSWVPFPRLSTRLQQQCRHPREQ
jgi:hypothetical protein